MKNNSMATFILLRPLQGYSKRSRPPIIHGHPAFKTAPFLKKGLQRWPSGTAGMHPLFLRRHTPTPRGVVVYTSLLSVCRISDV
jgi:hypothetical protein